MKLIQYINAFVAFVKKHALSAFIGLCLAVLFIGCIAYLFHDHHALFGVVALVFFVILVIPFCADCIAKMTGNNPSKE